MESVRADHPGAEAQRPRERTSPWALASLLCGLSIACPLLSLIAPLLGMKAIAHIRSTPGVGGRRIAAVGIALGLAGIVIWTAVAWWWNVEARNRMLNGPDVELRAGLAGDVQRFKRGFTEPGATLPDDVAAAFLSEVAGRYGRLISTQQDHFRPDPEPGRMSPVIPYVFHFETGLMQAEAKLVLFADGLAAKWEHIVILDDDAGDLSYPPGVERLPEPP